MSFNFITGNNFKQKSHYYLDEFGFGIIKKPAKDEIIIFFVKTDYIDVFFNRYKPNTNFILITHNSDYHITKNHLNYLNDDFLVKWFAQNVDVNHPKLFSIPIGIANEKWPHGDVKILENVINENIKKNKLIYSNFNIHTNINERSHCLNHITKNGVTMSKPKNFESYLRELSESYFVISPNGNGVDCHKTWESLYLKTIPIVTESININFYKNLPILIISDWSKFNINELNEETYNKIWGDFDPKTLNLNKFINEIHIK
jgi:hypothetical protein